MPVSQNNSSPITLRKVKNGVIVEPGYRSPTVSASDDDVLVFNNEQDFQKYIFTWFSRCDSFTVES